MPDNLVEHSNKEERRRFPRVKFSCRLYISASMGVLTANTENIGIGGIRVVLGEELKTSVPVKMEIFVGDGKIIKASGYVMWVLKRIDSHDNKTALFDTGIQFENIVEADKEYIRAIVESLNSLKNISG